MWKDVAHHWIGRRAGHATPTTRLPLMPGLLWLMACVLVACRGEHEVTSAYLHDGREVARWLRSTRVTSRWGRQTPDEALGDASFTVAVSTGAAGRALFYLELYDATADTSYLDDAVREVDLVRALTMTLQGDDAVPAGFYGGIAGAAFAIHEVHKAVATDELQDEAVRLIEQLHRGAQEDYAGVYWNEFNDMQNGAAGIGMVLLYAGDEMGDGRSLDLARRAGRALINRSVVTDDGRRWSIGPGYDLNLPNFSHGTAGVGFFLATLYQRTGQAEFLEAAQEAARYLTMVADQTGGLFLVPYGIPNEGYVSRYDIGWAHGPAGTSRLFYRLWEITGREDYLDVVLAGARSIEASGVPGRSSDTDRWSGPFRIDRRFGSAGAADFLLKLGGTVGGERFADLGLRIADDIQARATRSETGMHWLLPRYGFQGDEGSVAAFTGYHYGAAGLGLLLLRAHRAATGGSSRVVFPDDPFDELR